MAPLRPLATPMAVTTSPTWLGPVLVWGQQNYSKLLKTVRYFES